MKKILKSLDFEEVTDVAYITDSSIVAIKWFDSAVSIPIQSEHNLFHGVGYNSLSLLNTWTRSSKKEYVKAALNQKGTEAFEFNSYKELYEWLAIQ
jgi:hypothetical protein